MVSQEPTTKPEALIRSEDGLKYWNAVDPDVNGMLGGIPSVKGFSSISRIDLQGSRGFLARLGISAKTGRHGLSILEGGAGIGRITDALLADLAEHIDVVEPVAKFSSVLTTKPHVRQVFTTGLEQWSPNPGSKYDLVWVQWCAGYLNDAQMVHFLEQCKRVLNPEEGIIVFKENMSTSGVDLFDEEDSSVTREDTSYRELFRQAGLQIVKTDLQRGLPCTPQLRLFPVRMYALKPNDKESEQ